MNSRILLVFAVAASAAAITAARAQTPFGSQAAITPRYNATATTSTYGNEGDSTRFEPAPMPNADIYAPLPRVDDPKAAQLSPKLFQPPRQFRGDGYSSGSTAQGSQERSLKPAPGVSMKVPLD